MVHEDINARGEAARQEEVSFPRRRAPVPARRNFPTRAVAFSCWRDFFLPWCARGRAHSELDSSLNDLPKTASNDS